MFFNAAACFQNNNNNNNEEHDANAAAALIPKKMTLPLENDLPNPNFVRLQDDDDVNQESAKEEGSDKKDNVKDVGRGDDKPESSFLKSILLDRMTRKRSFGEDETPYMVKKSGGEVSLRPTVPIAVPPKVPGSPAKPPVEDCNDILRRRLLGLKDPNYDLMQQRQKQPQRPQLQPQRVEVKETRAEEMKGVDHEEVVRTLEDKAPSVAENLGEDAPQAEEAARPPTDYSHTSVLKHLLHRYTGSDHSGEDDGGADGGKADKPGA